MKDFDQQNPKIEQHEIENEKQEIKFVGQIKNPMNGHILFEYNMKTGELLEVKPIRQIAINPHTLQPIYDSKMKIKENCYYFYKLNQSNAIKHLYKIGLLKSTKILKE